LSPESTGDHTGDRVNGSDQCVDSEQIWHVTSGELAIAVEQATVRLAAGDTLVMPEALAPPA
jgi:hypothetical protein